VPERSLDGIKVVDSSTAEGPIARTCAQRTAFVGRTLRGPLNTPVLVRSFADFQQVFGGLWQPSPLSYAVEHFFEQGGRQAVIVRVANGAAPVTVSLPCESGALTLEALAPGTREFLRAAIDFDRLNPSDTLRFNLTVQRVRSPGSERIEAQESFRAVSMDPNDARFVKAVLAESKMVRVRGGVPLSRPKATLMPGSQLPGYVLSNPDGDDGQPLTDYDVIGSESERTGLFALLDVDEIAFLYIPPLSRTADVGASTLLAAERLCRERRMILIVDPPASWDSPQAAVSGISALGFHSDCAAMFYPRIVCMDRLRGRPEVFGSGAAAAGILSRTGEIMPMVTHLGDPELLLRAGAKLQLDLTPADRVRLATHGINTLQAVRRPSYAAAAFCAFHRRCDRARHALGLHRAAQHQPMVSFRAAGDAILHRVACRRRVHCGAEEPGFSRHLRRAYQSAFAGCGRSQSVDPVRRRSHRQLSQLHAHVFFAGRSRAPHRDQPARILAHHLERARARGHDEGRARRRLLESRRGLRNLG
jgi:hypothetical protein